MNAKALLVCLLLTLPVLAGCTSPFGRATDPTLEDLGFVVPADLSGPVAADDIEWPDLSGTTLRVISHGAFGAFPSAAARFKELTGADVLQMRGSDAGSVTEAAIRDAGRPQGDVLYAVDNALLWRAIEADLFAPYTPKLAPRVAPEFVFFDVEGDWPATPVDHGYIALNIDPRHSAMEVRNITIQDLFDVRTHADLFVTSHPRMSTPGLGFLLVTISVFGEQRPYDWRDYWTELFQHGVLVTSGWTPAYETHFSGGYGAGTEGHLGGHPIVTSYTTSPAYEWYWDHIVRPGQGGGGDARYGGDPDNLPRVLLVHQDRHQEDRPAVFQQVQTMGILRGTPNLAAAQAWVEFTLTDDFQALAAPQNAIYPVVPGISVDEVFGGIDPAPGTFAVLDMDWRTIGVRLEGWLNEWTDLCQAHSCLS